MSTISDGNGMALCVLKIPMLFKGRAVFLLDKNWKQAYIKT